MNRKRLMYKLGVLIAVAGLAACGSESGEEAATSDATTVARFVDADAEFPQIEFPGGALSLNDRCPVRKNKLNTRVPPVYVNGKPVGFC